MKRKTEDIMESLIIEKTKNLPTVEFNPNGNLLIEGRIIAEDSSILFEPMYEWVSKLESNVINLKVNLDYLNTSASKYLFTLLKQFNESEKFETVNIEWYYDEDDDDHLDLGQDYDDALENCEFEFYRVSMDSMAA